MQKVYADTFARLKNEVEVHVRPESLANMNRLLQKGVRTGKVRIRAGKWKSESLSYAGWIQDINAGII